MRTRFFPIVVTLFACMLIGLGQASLAAAAPAPVITGFQALADDNTAIPPDTQGAVGPSHVMTVLNSQVRIEDKAGTVLSTVSLDTFFSSLKNASGAAFSTYDPRVCFDPIDNRWVVIAAADPQSSTSAVLVAASQTADPTGNWNFIALRTDAAGANWAYLPALGLNKDWIVVTANLFTVSADGFVNATVYVIDKSQLYTAGATVTPKAFADSSGAYALQPAVTYDPNLATEYLVDSWNGNNNGVGTVRIGTVSGAVGSEAYTAGTFSPSVSSTWGGSAASEILPQLGATNKIDGGDDSIENCVYRNGSLWFAQTVYLPAASPTRTAAQWWQIDPTSGTVQQFGRVDDPTGATFYAYPTIAVNRNNDALLGYSSFSATQYPSASYSFRYGTDAPNTMQASNVFKAGEAKYYKISSGTVNRWGDYSATVVDPSDDLTLWTIQEYAATPSGGTDMWGTWWAKATPYFNLDVTLAGTGSGTVTSDPAGISCTGATCSSLFDAGSTVTLLPTPSATSTFSGWSGACAGNGACTVVMGQAGSVTATFDLAPLFKNGQTGTAYGTLQAAYDAASSGDVIQLENGTPGMTLTAAANKTVTLMGGYDASYTTRPGMTFIQGPLVISAGTLIVDGIGIL